jgi:hypothetical protein
VTEPYLGPVLKKEVTVEEVEQIMSSIKPLFDALEQIALSSSVKGRDKRIVIVIPSFKSHYGWIEMEAAFDGSSKVKDITSTVSDFPLHWDRPNSIIRRNIKIFAF